MCVCCLLYNLARDDEKYIKNSSSYLLEMDFKQVIKACLDFSTANNGTIQSYPAGYNNQLDIQSRTNTRTSIHIEQVEAPGAWVMEQRQRAVLGGGKDETNNSETVSTEHGLLEYLTRYWEITPVDTHDTG